MNPSDLLSVVVPVYFEEDCIAEFVRQTTAVLEKATINYEIVFVDDGSTDRTIDLIKEAARQNPRLRLVELSYNHGKPAALTAGVAFARGQYIIMMDPDLQDPPDQIPRFIAEADNGFDLVFGLRDSKKDNLPNRLFSRAFWWTLEEFTGLRIPRNLAVMRIFNRRFADKFLEYSEQNRFIEGIFMHISMRRSTLTIPHRERFAGSSKFNFRRKMGLAFNAILDYSELPLRLAVTLGAFLVGLGICAAVAVVILRLFVIQFLLGWPSLFVALIVGFGLQIFFFGIIGLYVGRIYKEAKRRPLFSARALTNFEP